MQTVENLFKNLNVRDLKPSQVYNLYLQELGKTGLGWPKLYMSSALTSGGYRRIPEIQFDEAFNKNAELAREIIKALDNANLLPKNDLIVFPGDTKTPEDSWGQFEYNLFFILMILGVESSEAIEKYVKEKIDMNGFLNRHASRDERLNSYKQIVELVEECIKKNNIKTNPVERIIELLDADKSLGSWMEAEIGKRFGVKIFRVQINTESQSQDEILNKIIKEINQIQEADSTFNFFGDNTGESIYLKEM